MGMNRLAALWGVAEATVFFIVPDVLLSYAARDDVKKGITACLYSLIGALIGGSIMYVWGMWQQETASLVLDYIPAINPMMIESVKSQLSSQGVLAMFLGPITGTPYKIYAAQAGAQNLSFWLFMLVTIPARLIRFVLVTTFFHYLLRVIANLAGAKYKLRILILSWVLFYSSYFYVLGF